MLLKGSKGTHLCFKVYIRQGKVHTAEWRVCDKFVLAELLLAEQKTFSVWQVSWSLRNRTGTGESSNKPSQSWEVALGWSSSVFASLCECIPECVCESDALPRTLFCFCLLHLSVVKRYQTNKHIPVAQVSDTLFWVARGEGEVGDTNSGPAQRIQMRWLAATSPVGTLLSRSLGRKTLEAQTSLGWD